MPARNDRRIRHLTKSNTLSYIPSSEYGKNGDTVLVKNENSNSIEQFIKNDGSWISLSTGRGGADSARRAGKKGSSSAFATTVQNITVNQPEGVASTGTGTSDHNLMENLDDDDHSQYTHNTIARTISAGHGFTGYPKKKGYQ